MSWDAYLVATDLDGNEYVAGEWNYTHNCNGMANFVVDRLRPGYAREIALRTWGGTGQKRGTSVDGELLWRTVEEDDCWEASWWDILNGSTAKESLEFLDLIIGGLNESPSFFREMNPDNGWGDYDQFIGVLAEMRARAADCPSATWRTSG